MLPAMFQLPKPPPSVEYQLDGDKTLLVKGDVREAAHECLFENDGDDKSIPQLIVDSLLRVSQFEGMEDAGV